MLRDWDCEDEELWDCTASGLGLQGRRALGLHCFGFGIVRTKGLFGDMVRFVVITPPPPHPPPPPPRSRECQFYGYGKHAAG